MSFDKDVNRIQSNFQTTNATETQAEHRCCVNLHEQIIEAYLPPRWKKGCYTRQLVPPPYPRTKTTLCLVLVSTIYNFIVRLPLNTTLHNASQQSTRTSCGTNVCYLLYTVFGSSVSCVSYSCKLSLGNCLCSEIGIFGQCLELLAELLQGLSSRDVWGHVPHGLKKGNRSAEGRQWGQHFVGWVLSGSLSD